MVDAFELLCPQDCTAAASAVRAPQSPQYHQGVTEQPCPTSLSNQFSGAQIQVPAPRVAASVLTQVPSALGSPACEEP